LRAYHLLSFVEDNGYLSVSFLDSNTPTVASAFLAKPLRVAQSTSCKK
jgi:hypothetical protein